MAERHRDRDDVPGQAELGRSAGWREVLLVAAVVVGAVFAFQVITSLLPGSMQDIVLHSPLAIVVLVVGTVGLLLGIARRIQRPGAHEVPSMHAYGHRVCSRP